MPDSPSSFVEVLYTGGTIGMQPSNTGLVPASGFEARAREAQREREEAGIPPWRLRELAPLIDSANMTPGHWRRLVEATLLAIDEGASGVLILHGTDTLAYSAAALSFQLLGIEVPVAITGAMLPAGVAGSDAWENFFDGLRTVAVASPERLTVQFHGQSFAGVSCRKVMSHGREAFLPAFAASGRLQCPPLPDALRARAERRPARVAVVELFPGITAAQLEGMLAGGVEGLVLECYGSGTAPSEDQALIAVLERACARGVLVVAISLCHGGGVSLSTYAAGSRLAQIGVIGGGAMTREAALGKLHWLLGSELDAAQRRDWLARDVLGERGESIQPAGVSC
ncbi:asparaginase [Halotalea alkalilenta]|uniref:asparaginase n=1 Tax=Halotalea alkalilenta TaxID=376489 RepID=UPI0006932DFF|nr:asparaginase [Halotalea alkalilenta]